MSWFFGNSSSTSTSTNVQAKNDLDAKINANGFVFIDEQIPNPNAPAQYTHSNRAVIIKHNNDYIILYVTGDSPVKVTEEKLTQKLYKNEYKIIPQPQMISGGKRTRKNTKTQRMKK